MPRAGTLPNDIETLKRLLLERTAALEVAQALLLSRQHEIEQLKLQIARLRGLQNYVDAQSGGRGRGWFRLVYSPGQARRVIARGAV